MATSSASQAEKIQQKNKELFTDSFNICKKLLIGEGCYLNERENNSFSDLSIVHGHKMYKAMMQALNSITSSNVQQDKIVISNEQLKQAPGKSKSRHDEKNDLLLDADRHQEVNSVDCHLNKNQDDVLSNHHNTTIDFIQPKKKFKPNEKSSLKLTKQKASEEKWNVKIPTELMQLVTAQNNNCIKLETGEYTQGKNGIETCKNKPRLTNNITNAKKITTQSTLKNVDTSTEEDEGSQNEIIEYIDNKRTTRISTGLLTQIKYLDGIRCPEMMSLINQWVYGKCIEHQNKGEKISNQDIKNWGVEAKKSLMFGHLRFSASDSWCTKFKTLNKISGHRRDLKITSKSVNI